MPLLPLEVECVRVFVLRQTLVITENTSSRSLQEVVYSVAGAARARRTQRKCISGGVARRNARRAAGVLKRPRCFHLTTQSRSRVRCTLAH